MMSNERQRNEDNRTWAMMTLQYIDELIHNERNRRLKWARKVKHSEVNIPSLFYSGSTAKNAMRIRFESAVKEGAIVTNKEDVLGMAASHFEKYL